MQIVHANDDRLRKQILVMDISPASRTLSDDPVHKAVRSMIPGKNPNPKGRSIGPPVSCDGGNEARGMSGVKRDLVKISATVSRRFGVRSIDAGIIGEMDHNS